MGIARSTYYDKPATSIDNTALVETMAVISCCSPQKPGHFSRCCMGRDELAG